MMLSNKILVREATSQPKAEVKTTPTVLHAHFARSPTIIHTLSAHAQEGYSSHFDSVDDGGLIALQRGMNLN